MDGERVNSERKETWYYVKEVLKYGFGPKAWKTLICRFAFYVHDHIAGLHTINMGENSWIHPTASIRNAHNIYLGHDSHIDHLCSIWAGDNS